MIRVRRIRADEGPALRAIRLRALQDSPAAFSSTLERERAYDDALWTERARAASDGHKAATFVAYFDGEWLGLATVLSLGHDVVGDRDTAELVSMWVSPEVRRQGLGALLVDAALEFARKSKAVAIELSVTRHNYTALRLYWALGFQTMAANTLPDDHPCKGEMRLRYELNPGD